MIPGRPRVCPVWLVGGTARRLLASDRDWHVAAVFRRSVYCQSAAGGLLCLGSPGIGAGPLNVLAWLSEPLVLAPGAPLDWDGAALRVPGRITLPLGGAPVWRPVPVPARWDGRWLGHGLATLRALARTRAPGDGLAPLLAGPSGAPPLLRAARAGLVALAAWLRRPGGVPPPAVAELIGLGPGLTPSGDDLLGGVLIALRGLGRGAAADRLAAWVLPRARERTSAISAAHLACAAAGEGAAALHGALAALCTPGAPGLGAWLRALDALGHTSGWDALAGLVLAAAVVAAEAAGSPAGAGIMEVPR